MHFFYKSLKDEFGERFLVSLRLWRFTLYGALLKIKLRNANSKLGLLWEPISTFFVSLVLGTVWVKILGVQNSDDYMLYVYLGMVIWAVIASSVSNLCATLLKNANKLITRPLSMYSYIFEDLLLSFVPFFMSIPIVSIMIFIYGADLSMTNIMIALLGFLNLCLGALGFALSIGTLAFILGDIRQLITSVMRLGFLVTPVIWSADRLGEYQDLLLLNPFYGYLHIMRASIMGSDVQLVYAIQSFAISASSFTLGIIFISIYSMKIQEKALRT